MATNVTTPYAYTTLSAANSLRLVLNGVSYVVTQFTSSFAVNEMPTAVCMLAVGRLATDGVTQAQANQSASTLIQMLSAQVYFTPIGTYKPDGTMWPAGEQLAFDGYLAGTSYQKVNGKVNFIVNLIHWLVDLSFSSCLSSISHVQNPAQLTAAAVIKPIQPGSGATTPGVLVANLIGHGLLTELIPTDIWKAFKTFLCEMAQIQGFLPLCGQGGVLTNQVTNNSRALKALNRIEGPTSEGGCNVPYVYGVPLPLTLGVQAGGTQGVAIVINHYLITDLWNTTYWDFIVNRLLQTFGLVLCPAIDRAVVVADTPGYNGDVWRTIPPEEYEYIDISSTLPRPLRAVVSHGAGFNENGANTNALATGGPNCIGGVYASPSASDFDGVVMYTQTPAWVAGMSTSYPNDTTGNTNNQPGNGSTTPDQGQPPAGTTPLGMVSTVTGVLNAYANMVFIRESLRGRNGMISGKLRFDIAPGAQIKLNASPEIFLGDTDKLTEDIYCEVSRVTIEINAESRRAATAMTLTYVRNATENKSSRTSEAVHPFYGTSIVKGFPLLPAYAF